MSKLWTKLKEEEFIRKETISKNEYNQAKEELNEKEFNEQYGVDIKPDNDRNYYKKEYMDISQDELSDYLAYEILLSQRKAEKHLNTMKNIMVFSLVVAIIGFVIGAILLL